MEMTCFFRIKSYDLNIIRSSCSKIQDITRMHTIGSKIINLPSNIKKITVNRSPHIDKKSREQFEIKTYNRTIEVKNVEEKMMRTLINDIQKELFIGINIKAVLTYSLIVRI